MSDLNFDLNINNYTIEELELLIKLVSPYNYSQISFSNSIHSSVETEYAPLL